MSEPNELTDQPSFDWDGCVPQDKFMRVNALAKFFACSTQHISNLIRAGEIDVPKELQESAPSRAAMRVPRASIVDFCKRRSSSEWREAQPPYGVPNKRLTIKKTR
jgi:hypothetical protein